MTTVAKVILWQGFADFSIKPECHNTFFKDAIGGFVGVFAPAKDEEEFADRVGAALKNVDLVPQTLEAIMPVNDVNALPEDQKECALDAIARNAVGFCRLGPYEVDDCPPYELCGDHVRYVQNDPCTVS